MKRPTFITIVLLSCLLGSCGTALSPNALTSSHHTGKVEWFNHKKGFGFIEYDGKKAFVRYSAIEGSAVQEGDLVEFDLVSGSKGFQAKHVRKVYSYTK